MSETDLIAFLSRSSRLSGLLAISSWKSRWWYSAETLVVQSGWFIVSDLIGGWLRCVVVSSVCCVWVLQLDFLPKDSGECFESCFECDSTVQW